MVAFARRNYDGGGTTTTLASSMSSSDTTFTLTSASGWPGTPGHNFFVVVDRGLSSEEKILCTSNAGTTVTVNLRGQDGTSATAHNANATVSLCGAAIDFDEANQITNLLGNLTAGQLICGAGAGTLPNTLTALAEGSLLYGKGAANPAALTVGSSSQLLQSNGTDPTWQTPANGYGITGFAATPPTPAVGLTSVAGHVASDVSLGTNTLTTIMSTASLAVGTWLVHFAVAADATSATAFEIGVLVNTATATFEGVTASGADISGGAVMVNASLDFIATVTVAGTLKFVGEASGVGTNQTVDPTRAFSFTHATGYTAVRIA